MADWAVARSYPHQEQKAVLNLGDLGIVSYLPKCLLKMSVNGKQFEKKGAIFPGYVFFKIAENWKKIFELRYVNGIIMDGESPCPIRERVIEEIKSREDRNGYILVEDQKRKRFRKGQQVRATCGFLTNQYGKFEFWIGEELIKARFNIFGRSTLVTMKAEELTVI